MSEDYRAALAAAVRATVEHYLDAGLAQRDCLNMEAVHREAFDYVRRLITKEDRDKWEGFLEELDGYANSVEHSVYEPAMALLTFLPGLVCNAVMRINPHSLSLPELRMDERNPLVLFQLQQAVERGWLPEPTLLALGKLRTPESDENEPSPHE